MNSTMDFPWAAWVCGKPYRGKNNSGKEKIQMNELQWQDFAEDGISDTEPDCETMIMKMNGVHYVVNNYFDGEDTLKKRFGAMIENSFESTNVPKDANENLVA